VQAEDFEAEGVQIGDVVDDVGGYGHVCNERGRCGKRTEIGVAKGVAKTGLNCWVAAEGEECPLLRD